MPQTLDVTGLPESVVHDMEQLIGSIRKNFGQPANGATENGQARSAADKLALFEAWLQSHAPCPVIADDSRESIYAGRGE